MSRFQFEWCHKCYERRELNGQVIGSLRSVIIYSERIGVQWAMPHISVPSDHPMAAIDATATDLARWPSSFGNCVSAPA